MIARCSAYTGQVKGHRSYYSMMKMTKIDALWDSIFYILRDRQSSNQMIRIFISVTCCVLMHRARVNGHRM